MEGGTAASARFSGSLKEDSGCPGGRGCGTEVIEANGWRNQSIQLRGRRVVVFAFSPLRYSASPSLGRWLGLAQFVSGSVPLVPDNQPLGFPGQSAPWFFQCYRRPDLALRCNGPHLTMAGSFRARYNTRRGFNMRAALFCGAIALPAYFTVSGDGSVNCRASLLRTSVETRRWWSNHSVTCHWIVCRGWVPLAKH